MKIHIHYCISHETKLITLNIERWEKWTEYWDLPPNDIITKQKMIVGIIFIWFYQEGILNIVHDMQKAAFVTLWHWQSHFEQSSSVLFRPFGVFLWRSPCSMSLLGTHTHTCAHKNAHLVPPPGFNCPTEWDVGAVVGLRRRSGAQGQSGPSDVHQNDRYPCVKTPWPNPKPPFPPHCRQTHMWKHTHSQIPGLKSSPAANETSSP